MKPEKRGGCSKDVPPELATESDEVDSDLFDSLFNATMKNEWGKVVKLFEEKQIDHDTKLTKSLDTALHLAISSFHPKTPSSHEQHLKEMIRVMEEGGTLTSVLAMQNQRGDTPLHLAAAVGWLPIFDSVEETDPSRLLHIQNKKGETPFFVAALCGSLDDFHRLCKRFNPEERLHLDRRKDGNTILHRAILEEKFELAYMIVDYYPKLVDCINEDGESPLHVLAMKPNVFKSSSHLRLYDSIIYYCTFVEKLRSDKEICDSTAGRKRLSLETNLKYPENYTTCVNIFSLLRSLIVILQDSIFVIFKTRPSCGTDEENQYHQKKRLQSRGESSQAQGSAGNSSVAAEDENGYRSYHDLVTDNYITCVDLFKFAMKAILIFLGVGFWRIQKIKEKKKRYLNAMEVLDKILEKESSYKYDGGQRPQIDGREDSGKVELPTDPSQFDSTTPQSEIQNVNKQGLDFSIQTSIFTYSELEESI